MAEPNEIAELIEGLAVHCRPPVMSANERARWLADWCDDLKDHDADAIAGACRRWREGTDRKFPLLGQLLPLIKASARGEDRPAGSNEPWRELTEDEYQALTLREKIRHHRIMASNCGTKAGPQSINHQPVLREEMPETWHFWKNRQANHLAEVERLTKVVNERAEKSDGYGFKLGSAPP